MSETGIQARALNRIVLNAGSGPRARRLHPCFTGQQWAQFTLDIDPGVEPDQVGSVTDMRAFFSDGSFDAIWSSHNLEHLHAHEVLPALREFRRVLRPEGFTLITCPDLEAVATLLVRHGLDHVAYVAPVGPITVADMMFGYGASIAAGNLFMAHNTGFTAERLGKVALEAGFAEAHIGKGGCFDLWALLLMPQADQAELAALFEDTSEAFLLHPGDARAA